MGISVTNQSCLFSAIKDSSCLGLMSEAAMKMESGLGFNRIALVISLLLVFNFSLQMIFTFLFFVSVLPQSKFQPYVTLYVEILT